MSSVFASKSNKDPTAVASEVADELNCEVNDALSLLTTISAIYWQTPKAKREAKVNAKATERAAMALIKAANCLMLFDRELRLELEAEGSLPKVDELLDMASVLDGTYRFFVCFCDPPSQGGKNWGAVRVAEATADLFRKLGRPITFGHREGLPSTEYGRAVESMFRILKLEANWREYAAAVYRERTSK